MSDNWSNRAENMICKTCMYSVQKAEPGSVSRIGRCRRHAPTMAGWPVVWDTDWCGDHKLDALKAEVVTVVK